MFNLYINCEQKNLDNKIIQDIQQPTKKQVQKRFLDYFSKLVFLNLEVLIDNNNKGDMGPRHTYCDKIELGIKKSFGTQSQFNKFGIERKRDTIKTSFAFDFFKALPFESLTLQEAKSATKVEIGVNNSFLSFALGVNRRIINLGTSNFMSKNINDFFGPGTPFWDKSLINGYIGTEIAKQLSFGIYGFYKSEEKLIFKDGTNKEGNKIEQMSLPESGFDLILNLFNVNIRNITTCGLWLDINILSTREKINSKGDQITDLNTLGQAYLDSWKAVFYTTFFSINYEYHRYFFAEKTKDTAIGASQFMKFFSLISQYINTLYLHLCLNDTLKLFSNLGNLEKYINFLIIGFSIGILKDSLLYGVTLKIGCVYITIWYNNDKWWVVLRFEPKGIDIGQAIKTEVDKCYAPAI